MCCVSVLRLPVFGKLPLSSTHLFERSYARIRTSARRVISHASAHSWTISSQSEQCRAYRVILFHVKDALWSKIGHLATVCNRLFTRVGTLAKVTLCSKLSLSLSQSSASPSRDEVRKYFRRSKRHIWDSVSRSEIPRTNVLCLAPVTLSRFTRCNGTPGAGSVKSHIRTCICDNIRALGSDGNRSAGRSMPSRDQSASSRADFLLRPGSRTWCQGQQNPINNSRRTPNVRKFARSSYRYVT